MKREDLRKDEKHVCLSRYGENRYGRLYKPKVTWCPGQ